MLVSIAMFAIFRPLFIRFMAPDDFARRRNLWLFVVAASFLAPNIWLYVLVTVPALLYVGKRDPNPVAVYLLVLVAVPPFQVEIPTFGLIGRVFPLDHALFISLALLLPILIRRGGEGAAASGGVKAAAGNPTRAVDFLVLAFLGLQLVLVLPYDSPTMVARRVVLMFIDVALPYFAIRRACRTRDSIAEAMAAFVMAMVVLAPLALLEFAKGWMLFAGIGEQWNAVRLYFPLYRGSFLRAQTTAGHSIFMGYFVAIGFGMWLYLQRRVHVGKAMSWLCTLTLVASLVVPLARGPWAGAAGILFVHVVLAPNPVARTFKTLALVGTIFCVALFSPWGSEVIDYLPFIGTVDDQTVIYREQLAKGSWLLIQQHPFFGSPYFLSQMEEFRTGEGIIDIVNTYATIALAFGLVGAGVFLAVFLAAIRQTYQLSRRLQSIDPDASRMGIALIACIVGTLIVLATTSFLHAMPYLVWALVGMTSAYVRLGAEASPQNQSSAHLDGIEPLRDGRPTWSH